ncbi:thylakoid lumenal 16.5 kDa protein, chloroplastic [Sesamum indicum]|uniref:Thylakoid lumenal 16.5 kDa protein, chloroplastic n=1 Tax=Sesamum indicum TaxID=4182 RepID=A0A6I9T889_SESIN|nr:thylakoid lumenal 16.5 kDa protein, chloroplastic [Sesamum indicum]
MATVFLPNAKAFLPSLPYASASTVQAQAVCCRAATEASSSLVISRRTISLSTLLFTTLRGYSKGKLDEANAAILEADDDEELLEKVKKDRKKRLERQGVISSSAKETAYLQDLVYKLSKVGQAIEKNDLSAASSVLGSSKDTEWVQKVNSAFNKLSSSDEEKTEVDTFNSSLASLISSVSSNDIEASKVAFVASATAFEKWSSLSGLVEQLKGL